MQRYALKVSHPSGHAQRSVVPDGAMLVVGRNADVGLRIPVDGNISSFHAVLEPSEQGLLVTDLATRNGTFADGQLIDRTAVVPGTTLVMGNTSMLVRLEEVTLDVNASGAHAPSYAESPDGDVVFENGRLVHCAPYTVDARVSEDETGGLYSGTHDGARVAIKHVRARPELVRGALAGLERVYKRIHNIAPDRVVCPTELRATTAGDVLFVRAWVDDEPAVQWFAQPRSPDDVIAFTAAAARALSAFNKSWWHRDVSPNNLFVGTHNGALRVTLTDPHRVRAVHELTGDAPSQILTTRAGFTRVAPEEILGRTNKSTPDLYALAASVYALVARDAHFACGAPADRTAAWLRAALVAPRTPLASVRRDLPEAFTTAIDGLLSHPSATPRPFQSGDAFVEWLEHTFPRAAPHTA